MIGRAGRTELVLRDIIDFGRLAADLVRRGRPSYDSDRMLQLAAEAIITRIGEAVTRIDPAFIDAHPELPFRAARAMRNLVAHEYHRVDPALMWGVLEQRIPALCAQIERLLDTGDH